MKGLICKAGKQEPRWNTLYTKKKIYQRLRALRDDAEFDGLATSIYAEVMEADTTSAFLAHFQSMCDSIIEEGTAIPVPKRQLNRRKELGLPEFSIDVTEVKKLAKRLGLR